MENKNTKLPTDMTRTGEKVAQIAVNQTGFGWFNLKIYMVCALVCIDIGFGLGNIGLIMPSAACDFKMSTVAKGRIGVSTLLGMMCGPYFWAGMADMKGRRFSLMISLFLHGITDGLGSIISNYWGFLICKFFNGFSLGAQLALLFTYLGEFQPCKFRDRILSWTELPWSFGLIITAGLGWAVIPLDIDYHIGGTIFFFKSWNLFLLICSLLGPLTAIWLIFLPETPKYFAETGEHKKLMDLLCQMYHENTGLSYESYMEKLGKLNDPGINEFIIRAQNSKVSPKRPSFRQKLKDFTKQTVELMQPPYFKKTILIGIVVYCNTSAYFTMIFWLPEIFQRFAIFHERFPGKFASVCTVSQILYSANATEKIEDNFEECVDLDNTVFFYNLILGVACVPPAIWLPFCVDRFGFKIHLLTATLLSSFLVFGLLLVRNSTQNLILSCLFEALSSIGITIILCTVVELYPTHLRVIASGFATFVGRIGAVVGIALVGYLIDDYCVLLIIIVGTHLSAATLLGFFIPFQRTKAAFEKEELQRKLANKNTETWQSTEMNADS